MLPVAVPRSTVIAQRTKLLRGTFAGVRGAARKKCKGGTHPGAPLRPPGVHDSCAGHCPQSGPQKQAVVHVLPTACISNVGKRSRGLESGLCIPYSRTSKSLLQPK